MAVFPDRLLHPRLIFQSMGESPGSDISRAMHDSSHQCLALWHRGSANGDRRTCRVRLRREAGAPSESVRAKSLERADFG